MSAVLRNRELRLTYRPDGGEAFDLMVSPVPPAALSLDPASLDRLSFSGEQGDEGPRGILRMYDETGERVVLLAQNITLPYSGFPGLTLDAEAGKLVVSWDGAQIRISEEAFTVLEIDGLSVRVYCASLFTRPDTQRQVGDFIISAIGNFAPAK